MRTELSKEAFIAKVESQVKRREELLRYYNKVFIPTLQKFDGKVYNKRFITALQNECNELQYVRPLEYEHVIVEMRASRTPYTDHEDIYLMVKLNSEGRIDYEASTTDRTGRAWITNFQLDTDALRTIINSYDEYMKIAESVRDAIETFATKVPYAFRENVRFTRRFYLK